MTMEHVQPWMKMYLLLNILIFQLVMLIFGGVSEVMKIMVGWKGGVQVGKKRGLGYTGLKT